MKNPKVTHKLDLNIRSSIAHAVQSTAEIKRMEYSVDWSDFPNSLALSCYHEAYDENEDTQYQIAQQAYLSKRILQSFLKYGVKFRNIRNNLQFLHSNDSAADTI